MLPHDINPKGGKRRAITLTAAAQTDAAAAAAKAKEASRQKVLDGASAATGHGHYSDNGEWRDGRSSS